MKSIYCYTLSVICTLWITAAVAAPAGTAFTYQGKLSSGGNAVSGIYDFAFALYDVASGPGQVGSPVLRPGVAVSNGTFSVALDFGSVFDGSARWMGISVKTNGSANYTDLSPRQPLTPTPYAVLAQGLVAGPVSAMLRLTNQANSFAGDGSGLMNLNPGNLGPGLIADGNVGPNIPRTNQVWLTGGNSGTMAGNNFLGTADNQPLNFKVNGVRAFRLEPTSDQSPNVIGGAAINFMDPSVVGGFIGGGGSGNASRSNYVAASWGSIVGGAGNSIGSDSALASIGGGENNSIDGTADHATIAGGQLNNITGIEAAIGGGSGNEASGILSVIAGGANNTVNSWEGAIGGGAANRIADNAKNSVIAGGYQNMIERDSLAATIAGGYQNINCGAASAIGGGTNNVIQTNAHSSTIAGGRGNMIMTNSWGSVIGGGYNNHVDTVYTSSTIAGGEGNSIGSSTINSYVAGGTAGSTISGGINNGISYGASFAVVAGGRQNQIATNATLSCIGGGSLNLISNNAFSSVIAGGVRNYVEPYANYAAIGGGAGHTLWARQSVIGGGFDQLHPNKFRLFNHFGRMAQPRAD